MLNKKPSPKCGACRLYKKKCHCLCHTKEDIVAGYHEILYEMPFPKSSVAQKLFNLLARNNKI